MAEQAFFVWKPEDLRLVQGKFGGTVRRLACDEDTPTDNLVVGIVQIVPVGGKIPLHHHTVEEFQYILRGKGIARDGKGNEYPLTAGTSVYCRPGVEGAHEYENVGPESLEILFVFSSAGGVFPEILVDAAD